MNIADSVLTHDTSTGRKSGQKSRGVMKGRKVLLVEDNELNQEIRSSDHGRSGLDGLR